ncbi:pentapeptide repeat-containing protein [Pseudomonas sp. SWRI196]|uniref:Pentapeptide repeat-containing protein n=1 Tax=Pseudomonas tehranensis TaxID=2745502 RepID=A0ABR6ULZ8_9PSED|nr:pentapeptide repeat-containing protein [Pseudomonas tehranensis]MBC3345557.1 pentapeptide repeat-containing protein [Pseudomonas tehranensis]
MTDPNAVKTYIGCYYLTITVNYGGIGSNTWFAYRNGDSLACELLDDDTEKDSTLFAFYLGDTFTPDNAVNQDTHNWLQVQSVRDGVWLDCGSPMTGGDCHDFFVALTSPDTPATLALATHAPYGIPPADNAIWMELIRGRSVISVLDIDIIADTVTWKDVELALVSANPSVPVTTQQLLPGASELNKQSYDQADFWYLFLHNVDFSGTRVTNSNLSNVTFSGIANFSGTVLDGSNLSGCMLDGANFRNASLKDVDLSNASLKGSDFTGAVLDNCNFESADLESADLALATLSDLAKPIRITRDKKKRTIFSNARVNKILTHAIDDKDNDIYIWSYAQMDGVKFMTPDPKNPGKAILDGTLNHLVAQYAVLTGVQFSAVEKPSLRYADLSYAELGGAALAQADLAYATFDNATLSTSDGLLRCNLSEANLMGATFVKADMSYAQMPFCYLYGNGAALVGANIMQADFSGAYLVAADFSGIKDKNAAGVNFDGACLINANFTGTVLSLVNSERATSFAKACLQGANFSGASVGGVNFTGAAVSTDNGTLIVHGGREDKHKVQYLVTHKPTNTAGATCPSGQTGPCTGTMWNADDAPMTDWHYGP